MRLGDVIIPVAAADAKAIAQGAAKPCRRAKSHGARLSPMSVT